MKRVPTRVRAKVWPAADPEPNAWLGEGIDGEASLQAAGGVGFSFYVSSGASSGNHAFSVDDVEVRLAN